MKFEQIFNQDGLYIASSFAKGFAFRIDEGILYGVTYDSIDDLLPTIQQMSVYKGLFNKEYKKVLIIKELFLDYEKERN